MVSIKSVLNIWPIVLLLWLSIIVVWPLFLPGYFSHHDDLQVMRIFEMKRCLIDLQIPCRWAPDMGYGNGYPLFNYYNPLPYYIGGMLAFFLPYLISAKILFFIPLTLGGISMYLLAKEILNREAGIIAGVLYLFAPYRALDAYVRGAVAESFAIAIFPLTLYFAHKLINRRERKYLVFFAVTLAAFFTSHTIMAMLLLPVLIFMVTYWAIFKKENVRSVVYGLLLGVGLSAFFMIPAFFEKNLVQIENLTRLDLDFRAHFATLSQLFIDRSWGYGASFPGPDDTISFQIGWPHWALAFLSIPAVFFKRKDKKFLLFYFGILLTFLLSVFMTHIRSAYIWESIGILRFSQFPWRFLAVTIFAASFLGGFLIYSLKPFLQRILLVFLIIITVILNWQFFKPEKFDFNLTDQDMLSGKHWKVQQKAAILDYLPKSAVEPLEPAPQNPIIISGSTEINNFLMRSNRWEFMAEVSESSVIEMPVFDFPDWQVNVDGKPIKHSNENHLGRISFQLDRGEYNVEGKLKNTPIRTAANSISLISLFTLIYYGKIRKTG